MVSFRCHLVRFALTGAALASSFAFADQWYVNQNGSLLEISYGTSGNQPQYAALDLNSSYLRLNYGPSSGWGTSVDTMPIFWSGGSLFQGYGVNYSTQTVGPNLEITLDGSEDGLSTHETVTIAPPSGNSITADVSASTTGTVALDSRPGEAFKPVFLSSMYDSPTVWDASDAFAGSSSYAFPSGGWIVGPSPVVSESVFGLHGGTSTWKTNAPTMTVTFPNPIQVAGWLTTDSNPNDDNVGYWAASDTVLSSWNYQLRASAAVPEPATMILVGGALTLAIRKKRSNR